MKDNDKIETKEQRQSHLAELCEMLFEKMEKAKGKPLTPWDFFWDEIPDDEDELEDLDEGVDNDALEIVVEPTEKKCRKSKKSVAKPRSK